MPYGTVNVDTVTTSTAGGILGAGNASIMKNRIINGAMVIDQRNAGASLNINGTSYFNSAFYTTDRWNALASQASKFTTQQNAGSVTPPTGFANYLGATSSSSYSSTGGDYFGFAQRIEGFNTADLGWGTANAKTVTLSFWVRSSLTGTFGGAFSNSANNRSYAFTYTISSANTWEYKTITIAGDTSGAWLTTNGTGVQLTLPFGMGTQFAGTAGSWDSALYIGATGTVNLVGTSGATFYITGVQLEVGSSATGFEYVNYQTSLANCQRYYQIADGYAGSAYNTTNFVGNVKFVTTMRTSPTVGETGVNTITYPGNADYTQSSVSVSINGTTRVTTGAVQINLANFSGVATNLLLLHNVNSGSITLSAEL